MRDAGLSIAGWLGASALAWLAIELIDVAAAGGLAGIGTGGIGFAARLAAGYALWGGLVIGVLHLALWAIARWWRADRALLVTTAAVAACALWPAMDQAAFLTSGDGIAAHASVGLIRLALTGAVIASLAGLWVWHVAGVRANLLPGWLQWLRTRRGIAAWAAVGVLGVVVTFHLLTRLLDFYAHFALFVTWPCWLAAATLLYRPALENRRALAGFGAVFVVVLGASLPNDDDGRDAMRARSKIAGYTALLDPMQSSAPAANVPRIDISDPSAFACAQPAAPAAPPAVDAPRRNVIVISIDALRADVLDLDIDGAALTPNLRAFAASAVYAPRAQSTYPATIYALGGAFTGLAPSELLYSPGIPLNLFSMTRDRFDRQRAVLPAEKWFKKPIIKPLLVQSATIVRSKVDAADATDTMLAELADARTAGQSVFAWVHYFDAHEPYQAHPGFDFGTSDTGRYRSEIAHVDAHVGRLLDALTADGWLEDSLVIVLSDHGEALGERGYVGHHVYLNGWIIDVPLIVRYPGSTPRRLAAPVSLLDIAPTVLTFAGLPVPDDMGGVSLFGDGAADATRIHVAEAFPVRGSPLFKLARQPIASVQELAARIDNTQNKSVKSYEPKVAVVRGDYRLIASRTSGAVALYDRAADPGEQNNLASARPAVVDELTAELAAWHRRVSERVYCRVARAAERRINR